MILKVLLIFEAVFGENCLRVGFDIHCNHGNWEIDQNRNGRHIPVQIQHGPCYMGVSILTNGNI